MRHQAVHNEYRKTTYLGIIECDQLLRVLRFYPKIGGCLPFRARFQVFGRDAFSGRGGDY